MPPSEIATQRLDLIERELSKAVSEYPSASALDRLRIVRVLVRLVKGQTVLDEEATIPVLDVEVQPGVPRR